MPSAHAVAASTGVCHILYAAPKEAGVNLTNFGPNARAESLRIWARFAKEHGFALARTSDHVAPTRNVAAQYRARFYDAFTTLAGWPA